MRGVLLIALLIGVPALASGLHGDDCDCREEAPGWIVYPDSASGPPDFFSKSAIQIGEIILCERAAHLFFEAKQTGVRQAICLVVAEPTYPVQVNSALSEQDLREIDLELQWQRHVFREGLLELRDMIGAPSSSDAHRGFKTGWFRRPPKLHLVSPLTITWKKNEVELVGNIDVYFRE